MFSKVELMTIRLELKILSSVIFPLRVEFGVFLWTTSGKGLSDSVSSLFAYRLN